MSKITLGPIIGNVDFQSARILVEFDSESEVKISLTGNNENFDVQKQVQANRPSIFVFNGLKPSVKYSVLYQDQQIGSFNTFREQTSREDLRFAFISCNAIQVIKEQPENKQMWRDMQKRIENDQIDYMFHIGDQVYQDFENWFGDTGNAFAIIQKKVKDLPINELEQYTEECRELLRDQYRQTWNFAPTKFCLSHAPSTMILDDHEVVDDAGRKKELKDQNHWMYWYSQRIARHVYYEYQRQLVDDIDFENLDSIDHEYREFVIQNTGIFLIDTRAHFIWHGDEWAKGEPIMGKKQKERFIQDLSDDGIFKDCKTLIVMNSVPLLLLSKNMLKLGNLIINDFQEHWAWSHQDELIELFDILRKWQDSKQGRSITLIGGDVHYGGFYELFYNNKPVFRQLITSSIGQKKLPLVTDIVAELAPELAEELSGGYKFEKHDFVFDNNYGLVTVQSEGEESGNLVVTKLVHNKGSKIKEDKSWTNRNFTKNSHNSGCCEIF